MKKIIGNIILKYVEKIIIKIFDGYRFSRDNPDYWEYAHYDNQPDRVIRRKIGKAIADTIESTIDKQVKEKVRINEDIKYSIPEMVKNNVDDLPNNEEFIINIIDEINKRQLKK